MNEKDIFDWTNIYQEIANKLLEFKNDRAKLLSIMENVFNQTTMKYPFQSKGTKLDDICPFTIFGCFNKGIKDENRILILTLLKEELKLKEDVPTSFEGIPVLNNMNAWFFGDIKKRPNDITNLWNMFEAAISFADNPNSETKNMFIQYYDIVSNQPLVKWKLSMGLYWIRPFYYLNLDDRNRTFITSDTSFPLMVNGGFSNLLKIVPDAITYISLIDKFIEIFNDSESTINSFPVLSYNAWEATKTDNNKKLSSASFLRWFIPLVNALKELGGSATPEQARNKIIENLNLSKEEINETRGKTNINKFANEVAFARSYLVHEGIIDKTEPGIWKLTEKGKTVILNDEMISDIFKKWVEILKKRREDTQTSSPDQDIPATKYWIYAPGQNSHKWDEFYLQEIMGIGWHELGNLKNFTTREEMRSKMKELWGANKNYNNDSLATWQFAYEVQIGDIIYAKKGKSKLVGRGIVESDYIFDDKRREYKHIRKVKWTNKGEWEHPGQAVLKTLTDVSVYTDYVQKLESLFIDEDDDVYNPDEIEIAFESYIEDDFLNEVFMSEDQYNSLVELLKVKKNVILQGAPGVGKTFAAKRLAYSIMGKKDSNRVMMVQFHQSYSYEDFIMGYRPKENGFELAAGPFYKFCKRAHDDIEKDYFFIIDEINRGNLSKIFGEMLMLIEKDKRGDKLRLLYSNELFTVPKNLYIIGMMNTADRSLALIDYALRRRFGFFELEPAFDSEGFMSIVEGTENSKLNLLVEQVRLLNEAISKDESLGAGFRIGHSYLCTEQTITDKWMESVIKYEIIPLIKEYWFDDESKIELWTKKLCGVLND